MKTNAKKILLTLLAALTLACICVFGASAESVCNHSFTKYVYDNNATCTQDGTKTAVCDYCNVAKKTVTDPDHPKTGHKEVTLPAVAPTCSKTGLTEGKKCSVCGVVTVEQSVVPKTAHSFSDELFVIVDSTCYSTGVKARKCTVCGAFEQDNQEKIPMKEHTYTWTVKNATCSASGLKTGTCTVCHAQTTQVIPALEHKLGQWKLTKEPTCSQYGTETAVCSVCGAHKERNVEKAAHDVRTLARIEPTCEEYGLTEGKICYVCKEIIVPQKKIAPLGHDYFTVADIKAPSCTEKGSGHIYCLNEYDENGNPTFSKWTEIPKIPHVDNDGDGLCDVCATNMKVQTCGCFCHNDTIFARLVRFIDTLLSKLLGKDFRCCDDMEPYGA